MNKWLWFLDTMKTAVINLFLHDSKERYWLITERRLNELQVKEKSFNALQAECNLWHRIAEFNKQKLQDAVWWLHEWEKTTNEKQSI